jgi:hypothetical protein
MLGFAGKAFNLSFGKFTTLFIYMNLFVGKLVRCYSITRYVWLFLIVLVATLIFQVQVTSAQTGLSIKPVKASHTLEPGETIIDRILLENQSTERILVEVDVQDFVPAGGTSNINFVGRAEGNTTVRDWITLNVPDKFEFAVGESKNVEYTIKAPPDAEPGGHFGVAFFTAKRLQEDGVLKIGTRIGMLYFITIPGNQNQKGKILDFSAARFVQRPPVLFEIKFQNEGNVHFEPKGEIVITNILGKEVGRVQVAGQTVLPTGNRDLKAIWGEQGDFLVGRYKASLSLVDGEGNQMSADSLIFYVFPIWHIVGFILAIIILYFVLKFLKSRINISFTTPPNKS